MNTREAADSKERISKKIDMGSGIKILFSLLCLCCAALPARAFDQGFVLGLRANFSGSYTDPHIDDTDLGTLKANKMLGNVGFVMGGEAELTYIFGARRYFGMQSGKIFGGLGLAFNVGVGQGYSGQQSGSLVAGKQIDVFCNIYLTPVATFGLALKSYFFNNRLDLSFGLGGRLIADPTPMYECYANDPSIVKYPVGTIIVTEDDRSRMNPLGLFFKGSIEYNQPINENMQLVLGGYASYCIYKPGYVTMPQFLKEMAEAAGADFTKPLDSFYLNSFDFGLTIGLVFKASQSAVVQHSDRREM